MSENEITEEELVKRIEIANNNDEIKKIIKTITNDAMNMGAYLVESRVKSKKSALDSFRNNKNDGNVSMELYRTIGMTNPATVKSFEEVDTVVDLLALRIITKNSNDIYKIKDYLNDKHKSFIVIDLINEPLVGFEYRAIHMYFKIKIDSISFDIPMEIQLKTYEMHHTWVGLHDTIYKNDKMNLKDGCVLLPVLFKIFEFNAKIIKNKLIGNNVESNFAGIDCIIDYNKNIFSKYDSIIEESCYLFAKSIYLDKNKDSECSEEYLFSKFQELKLKYKDTVKSPLHIYGNRCVECATYDFAISKF